MKTRGVQEHLTVYTVSKVLNKCENTKATRAEDELFTFEKRDIIDIFYQVRINT